MSSTTKQINQLQGGAQIISRETEREDRFFDRALSNIPKNARIISAKGTFAYGERSVEYTYRHGGRLFTTTLSTEGGQRA